MLKAIFTLRLNRLQYIALEIGLALVLVLPIFPIVKTMMPAHPHGPVILPAAKLIIPLILWAIPFLIVSIFLQMARLRDVGLRPAPVLATVVLLNLVVVVLAVAFAFAVAGGLMASEAPVANIVFKVAAVGNMIYRCVLMYVPSNSGIGTPFFGSSDADDPEAPPAIRPVSSMPRSAVQPAVRGGPVQFGKRGVVK